MRYSASEKAEIIQLVEHSHLPAKRTLDKLGIPRATFYRWYDRYRTGGPEALSDHRSRPDRVWNRIPQNVRHQIIDLALELPELSPRELAVRFTDERKYFVSEASVYGLLKAHAASSRSDHALLTAASISSSCRFSSSQTVGALPAPIVLHFIFKGCISINGSKRHGIGGFLRFDGRIDRVRDSLRASSRNRQWKRRTSRPGSGHPLTKNLEKSGWLCLD